MSSKPRLYFGSQSKFRRDIFNEHLLETLSKDFEIQFVSADIDEKQIRHENPTEMVKLIARGKREELIRQLGGIDVLKSQNAIIFTTDQVAVTKEGVVREKPEDLVEAREFLRSYSNSFIATFTAYLMFSAITNEEIAFVEPTKTFFKEFDDSVIDGWLERGDCQKACGGFAVGHMMEHVDRIDGGKLAVEGLTPATFMTLLKQTVANVADAQKQ
jgi:septum formation protein